MNIIIQRVNPFSFSVTRPDYAVRITLPTLSTSSDGEDTLEPPAGTRKIDYKMQLMVDLTDTLGAVTTYFVDTIEVSNITEQA